MNIRLITSTPKAIAFAGSEIEIKTTKRTEISPLPPKAKSETRKKLSNLSPKQVESVDLTPVEGWRTVNFRTSRRNRIERVSWATDGSRDIYVRFSPIKSTDTIIEKSHNVGATRRVIAYLNRLAETVIARRGGIGHLRKP